MVEHHKPAGWWNFKRQLDGEGSQLRLNPLADCLVICTSTLLPFASTPQALVVKPLALAQHMMMSLLLWFHGRHDNHHAPLL